MSQNNTGIVKWYNGTKGFGFIAPDNGPPDLFVHHTSIQIPGRKDLAEGEKVQFDIVKGVKGMEARNVTKV